MGQLPYTVFLSCPSVIACILEKKHPLNPSAQAFAKELHSERFSTKVSPKFKGMASHSIRDDLFNLINKKFEQVFTETKDRNKAIQAIAAVSLVHSVFETSDKPEFSFTDLHASNLELGKDLSEDINVYKVIIVCNCDGKKSHKESRESLIKEMKKKEGKVNYKYDFECLNTKELFENKEFSKLLIEH